MYSLLSRYGQLMGLGIGVFFTIALFVSIFLSRAELTEYSNMVDLEEKNAYLSQYGTFNIGLIAVILLSAICLILMLGFGIYSIAQNPKGSKKILIGVGVLIAIFAIGYFVASGSTESEVVQSAIDKFNGDLTENALRYGTNAQESISWLTPGKSNFISGALLTTAILGGLAFIGLIASEIANLFR